MSAADFNARRRDRRLSTCRHFTGVMNETCAVGVVYRSVRDTSGPGMARWPCTGAGCPIVCDKKEPRTAEEIDAEDREFADRIAHFLPARTAIIATKQRAGAVDCPKCGGNGALRFTVSSYNGHVHAACNTEGCLSWME